MSKQKRSVQLRKIKNNKKFTNARRKAAKKAYLKKPVIVTTPDGMGEIVGAVNYFIKELLQKTPNFWYFRNSCRLYSSKPYTYVIKSPVIACFKDDRILIITNYVVCDPDILTLSCNLRSNNGDIDASIDISYSDPNFFDDIKEKLRVLLTL